MPWDPSIVFLPSNWRDRYLTVEQLAVLIGRTPRAVYNMQHRNQLPPCYTIGRRLSWYGRDVDDWIRGGTAASAAITPTGAETL